MHSVLCINKVIFQGEERNGPKQYHLRGLDQPPRKLNSVPSEDRLQRPPLHSSEPHKPSYSQLLGMAKNNESRGKQALKGNEKMKSYSTMLGNIRPPVLVSCSNLRGEGMNVSCCFSPPSIREQTLQLARMREMSR